MKAASQHKKTLTIIFNKGIWDNMEKKEAALKIIKDKGNKFHRSVTIHYACGVPKKIEFKEVFDFKQD